jgi:hypothetical protein
MRFIGVHAGRGLRTTPIVPVRKHAQGPFPFPLWLEQPKGNSHVGLGFDDATLPRVLAQIQRLAQLDNRFVVARRCRDPIQPDLATKSCSGIGEAGSVFLDAIPEGTG